MRLVARVHWENNRSMTMNKEEIYDAQISPLMQQVIAISEEHGIAMMASFSIGHDGEGCFLMRLASHTQLLHRRTH
jgi:hypothetical protein